MLRIKGSAGHSRSTDLRALLMKNFEHRFLRIESTAAQRCARKSTEFALRRREPGRDVEILCDRMLCTKGSAEHSPCTCVDRPSRSADEQFHNNAPHKKCLREKTTACVSLFVFFRIRRGTFPYNVEDNANTTTLSNTNHT